MVRGCTDGQELVGSLTAEDFVVNNGVLTTAHSIFRP
jgi:hypothetical protein